ncbi:MAG: hypothetical protein FWC71_05050 [Defluviitaleaceae bacterium]|nr:hypothetical protein [Defluviitaleaceae bacterium]
MRKLKYILRSFRTMGLGRMWITAKEVAREYKCLTLVIFMDMLWCAVRYGAGQTDYKAMRFVITPGWRRKTYVTRGVNNDYIRKLNHRDDYHKVENKVHFNEIFAAYLGRAWINLAAATPEEFDAFIRQCVDANPQAAIIVKPIDSLGGHGIEKINISTETDPVALYNQLVASCDRLKLVEECIIQHPSLAALYPPSVNTVRLVTVRADDGVHFIIRILRTGAGGNVVDNSDVGGLYMFLDADGTVVTPAVNYSEETFEAHPDTGAQLLGFTVPFFAEAVDMVTRAAQVVPTLRYIGWDVAITVNGPLLIEANHNPAHSGFQKVMFMGESEPGKRPLFAKIFENIH